MLDNNPSTGAGLLVILAAEQIAAKPLTLPQAHGIIQPSLTPCALGHGRHHGDL